MELEFAVEESRNGHGRVWVPQFAPSDLEGRDAEVYEKLKENHYLGAGEFEIPSFVEHRAIGSMTNLTEVLESVVETMRHLKEAMTQ